MEDRGNQRIKILVKTSFSILFFPVCLYYFGFRQVCFYPSLHAFNEMKKSNTNNNNSPAICKNSCVQAST